MIPVPTGIFGNPIFSSTLADQHCQMIDDLLASCSVQCLFVFGGYERECDCTISGAPTLADPDNFCTSCAGKGFVTTESSGCIPLAVEFDTSRFASVAGKGIHVAEGFAETMCRVELLPHIRAAQYVVLDSCNSCYVNNRYKRVSEPEFCGIAQKKHIMVLWERIA